MRIEKRKRAAAFFTFFIFLFSFFFLTFSLSAQTLSLEEALETLGEAGTAEFRWDPFFSAGTLVTAGHEASFASGRAGDTGLVLLGHREVLTLPLPFLENGSIRFPETFIREVKKTFNRYIEDDLSRYRIGAIIIDPGHGGRDPGASWEYNINGRILRSVEKYIVLQVSLQLHALLTASFPDKKILLTRSDDSTVSREARVNMANSVPLARNEVAMFVSVHANSSFNRNARGFEVWYLNPNVRRDLIDRSRFEGNSEIIPIINSMLEQEIATESIILANSILKRLTENVGHLSPNRGLKAADWFVVRNARMPSVLVELGFTSNKTDALLMSCDTYLKKLSDALYKGISDFINFFERAGGFIILP